MAEPVVIAALGDSLTQGYGLVPADGLVPQLERWLVAAGADVRLINAGVSGDTSAGGLARVHWTLTDEVQGMIVALGGNDMLRGLDPTALRANIEGILQAAAKKDVEVMLVGFQAPTNYGPDYKAAFDAAYPELARDYEAVFLDSFLAPLSETDRPVTDFLQGDMIHPNKEGVALMVEAMGPRVLELIDRIE